MVEIIGWVGGILLSVCAIPQAFICFLTKSGRGINIPFLMMWFLGEIATLVYVLHTSKSAPLILNYLVNLLALSVILYYRLNPGHPDERK